MSDKSDFDRVMEIIYKAPAEEVLKFVTTPKEDLIEYHSGLGRMIRNELSLWERGWEPTIVDGVDMSPHHPDAVSMRLIEEVHDELQRNT